MTHDVKLAATLRDRYRDNATVWCASLTDLLAAYACWRVAGTGNEQTFPRYIDPAFRAEVWRNFSNKVR